MLRIETKYNFTDILTKHWGYQGTYYKLIQLVFHHEGNTAALFLDDTFKVMRFGILGSVRTLSRPQNGTLVCGQTVVT